MPTWLTMPLLHAGQPEPTGWLHSNWRPEPSVVIGVLALIGLYVIWTGSKNRDERGRQIHPVSAGQRFLFIAGALTVGVALSPPLDDWSDHFLLSAHMLQHLLLMMLAVPLLIAGTPSWLVSKLLGRGPVRPVMYMLTRPVVSFLIGNLIIVIWHMPFAYDAMLENLPLHIAAHLSFMVAAFFLWWPVMSRSPELPGLPPLLACLYLFLSTIPGGIVGAFITLAAPGLYTVYPDAPRIWGISLGTDQQIAGLTMWVITGLIYLGWITVIFFRWAADEERREMTSAQPTASPAHP
ncbi:MAG TPA: cytochrome c oxidase assembly protein [Thermomicrobiales bacterium]|nr:cytochrome c oxidase assembly protein [Thermomicrobiales bacterium]